MFWDKLSIKERIGLSLAFMVMAVALMDRIVITPIRKRFERLDQTIKISEKQLALSLRNVHQKEQIEEKFNKYVTYVEQSGSDDQEVASILEEIESMARQSKVDIANMKPETPKEVDFYKEYAIEIEAEGEASALMSFLHQLNTSTQLLRVEKLHLSAKKKGETTLKASLRVTRVLVL